WLESTGGVRQIRSCGGLSTGRGFTGSVKCSASPRVGFRGPRVTWVAVADSAVNLVGGVLGRRVFKSDVVGGACLSCALDAHDRRGDGEHRWGELLLPAQHHLGPAAACLLDLACVACNLFRCALA